jgi:RNA polymerase sigma-70 factor, ECF subfamily
VDLDNKIEEKELIEKARRGDTDSFSALVESHQQRAIHAARSLVGNLEDARDLTQEAFVKAFRNLEGFKSESRFYTWFYRILMNTCKDFLRKKNLRRAFSFWGPAPAEEETDPLASVPDRSPNAASAMASRELGSALDAALEKLPFRQKSVFALRYLEGMSLDEIAESLGLTTGAVKAHLWQAGQKMKIFLKDQWTEV